ncbi:MAG: hypothetical protein GX671_07615, partial [Clostridiales bacterium]|nr:hypothetical protein [Clostridiales bacterium]
GYPPFTDLIVVEFTAMSSEVAMDTAGRCREYLMSAGLPDAEKIFEPML